MRFLLAALPLLLLVACHHGADEPVAPDYPDWYALRAPDDRAIQAAIGDIDGTLIITTGANIYRTTDRGKTWQPGSYKDNLGIVGFAQGGDSLLALTAGLNNTGDSTAIAFATNGSSVSFDRGATWQPNHNHLAFDILVPLNRLKNPAGTEYSITVRQTPVSPGSSTAYLETTGIKDQTGRRLTLPHDHQIKSLYFDKQSRLYVSASAALCGTRENFAFCGEHNGVLYVSKKPQP
ncbi:hypothetical protein [Hymenobacter psoromatis]|uniref:hypothetical protein n=1 Tax=Hymenobacter psoromatis TaxID=1484116 RepID=UPI001CBCD1B8|nr:hypothetical protein [Hymenobacter psoromatis]